MQATKKQIRSNVFETNSSSSHSLTLSQEALVPAPFPPQVLRRGYVDISLGEFGWEWQRYYDPIAKLSYLATQVTDGHVPEDCPDNTDVSTYEHNQELQMLGQVVKEHTGCEMRIYGSGYIDHQSAKSDGANGMELFADKEKLKRFIFDANSYIQTGNDNSGPGWHIPTDRGPELVFVSRIVEVPKDYVNVKLHYYRHMEGLASAQGGIIDARREPQLWADLADKAILTEVHLAPQSYLDYLHGEYREYAVTDGPMEYFKISGDVVATREPGRQDGAFEHGATATFAVPQDLAKRIAQLDPHGEREFLLENLTQRLNSYEQSRAGQLEAYGKPTPYLDKVIDELQAAIAKLKPKAKATSKPATKKVAAKKVVAKKAPAKKVAAKKAAAKKASSKPAH